MQVFDESILSFFVKKKMDAFLRGKTLITKILREGLIVIFLQFSFIGLFAQYAPGLVWKKVIGGKKNEIAHDVIPTFDGNIALVGETTSAPALKKDAVWILLDAAGSLKKQVLIGGERDDVLKSMVQTDDGGFVLAGATQSFGQGGSDGWLVKLNAEGDTLWRKTAGAHRQEAFTDLIQTADGGLIAVGSIQSPKGQGRKDMWVYSTYEDGSLRWQRSFGERQFDEAKAVVEDEQGNIAIAGVTSSGKGSLNIWLFILDKDGSPLYHRIFGNRQREEIFDLVATQDGGFALAGYSKGQGQGLKDAWIVKTAADGEMIWESNFGGRNNDSALSITEMTDGGLVLAGYTYSHLIGANTSGTLLVKMDRDGNKVWEQTHPIGGKGNDVLNAISMLPNGCLMVAGSTNSKSEGAKGNDIWVMRLNCDFDINTSIATQLSISNVSFEDNGDQILEEQEQAFLQITLENKGQQDAYEIDLVLDNKSGGKGIEYRESQKLGFLAAGKSKKIRLPINGVEGLELGDALFDLYISDASRSKTLPFEWKIETKPLVIPSNYLDVAWIDPSQNTTTPLKDTVKYGTIGIRLKARSDQPLLRKHFTIYLNGQAYKVGQKAGEASLRSKGNAKKVYTYEYTNQVDLRVGLNNIVVEVDNDSKKIRSTAIQVFFSDKPNLHVLSIGIDHDDLEYTKKDALDFAAGFKNQEGKLFDKIFLTTLVSGQQTRAGRLQTNGSIIKKAFQDLKDNYTYSIYKRDLLIIFLSSHGKAINNEFKVVPSDFTIVGESALIDYKNDIIEQLEAIDCHKVIFIDACQSGSSISQKQTTNKSNSKLPSANTLVKLSADYQNTGTLASCEESESSWEDESWENGAFTEAIMAAFKNEKFQDKSGNFSVSPNDNIITLGELYQYIQRRVPQMIENANKAGSQHPFISDEQLEKIKNLPVFEIQ